MNYKARLIHLSSGRFPGEYLIEAGVDPEGIKIISDKARNIMIRVDGVSAPAANIIKQQMLSLGGDAAVHRDVISGKDGSSTLFILGNLRKLIGLPGKLSAQPFKLPELGKYIERLLYIHQHPPRMIKIRKGQIKLDSPPLIMGILNVTPDSFSDGGMYLDHQEAVQRGIQMVQQGANIIDVGGESTRPGARPVEADEELDRVLPVVENLVSRTGIPISIDTRKPEVARAAISAGARIVNDISGFENPDMIELAADSGTGAVVMHMQGDPRTMQDNPRYQEAVPEVVDWLENRTEKMINNGIPGENIIIDPGIGFGKRLKDNLEILNHIGDFKTLGFPVLTGYSRKSFLGMITERDTSRRLWGGLAALARCIMAEISLVRVHDIKESIDFMNVWKSIERGEKTN